jgi:hypothetical protein
VGVLDILDELNISDEEKARLRQEHEAELTPLSQENESLKANERRERTEQEIAVLSDMGFKESPGLLKYVRRIFLSADAEEPGAVLLSDSELNLSGDQATGATGKEEVSVAGALRKFIELMPKDDKGQLKLSEQVLLTDDVHPDDDESNKEEDDTDTHKKNLERVTGRPIDRTRKRYQR